MLPLSSLTDHFLFTQPWWILLPSFLGLLSLSSHVIAVSMWVYKMFFRPMKDLREYGSWAVITGATDGIGKAFSHQLAGKGLNLVLVGRTSTKLKTVKQDIRQKFPLTKIITVEIDFSVDPVSAGVQKLKEVVQRLDVGILINNVGITYPTAMFFHEVEEKVWMDVVRVNLEGTTRVTQAVLPAMVRKKTGAIVNVGSGAAIVVPSHPLYTIYAATKAYVDQLSRCLHMEYKNSGIDIQCQVPLYVATRLTSNFVKGPSLFIPSADDYARAAMRQIGYEHRCTPYWTHSVQWFVAALMPESLLDAFRLCIGLHRRKMRISTHT